MKIFSLEWIIGMFVNAFITIFFIYLIKLINKKINVPVVSDVIENV